MPDGALLDADPASEQSEFEWSGFPCGSPVRAWTTGILTGADAIPLDASPATFWQLAVEAAGQLAGNENTCLSAGILPYCHPVPSITKRTGRPPS